MRKFDYIETAKKLLNADIVSMLTKIHEYKGRFSNNTRLSQVVLDNLVEIARVQSTDASNKIEGISTSNERLNKLVKDKTQPRNRDEKEIAGYRDVLRTIHLNYEYIHLKPSFILQMHRDLYMYSGSDIGGKYKSSDNYIKETDAFGNDKVRFLPVPAWETEPYIDEICRQYNDAINAHEVDALLLTPIFILDFLCVHPFNDGNGRMSRLLSLLLLYRSDYMVGKYVSIEHIIEQTKETYYEALEHSSIGWHEATNDYEPIVRYMLGILIKAYRDFDDRCAIFVASNLKGDQVEKVIKASKRDISKLEIMKACPNMSEVTIRRKLIELVKAGTIIKIGGGRYTRYAWNHNKEDNQRR